MIINADLHIHSRFSGNKSPKMDLWTISVEAPKKGIHIVGTGDCLHPQWLTEIARCNKVDEGTFELNGTRFILSVEVETKNRVHHLIYFPSIQSVKEFRKITKHFSKNLDIDGRPIINISGEELASIAREVDALIGPAHAFTPWTGVYANHKSIKECYGDLTDYVSFVELGLSADTNYADRIKELHRLTFLSNSDTHSPHPVRFAREFNRFKVEDLTFNEIKKAILRQDGNRPVLNVGLPPEEGKYNESTCRSCFTHYGYEEAKKRKWRCKCGKKIKKGVKDTIFEIGNYSEPIHPDHRPPYVNLIPLPEIITKAIGHRNPFSKTIYNRWWELISTFNSEIDVLLEANIEDISTIAVPAVTEAIKAFREGKIIVKPGGGGKYGIIEFPSEENFLTVTLGAK